MNRKSKPLREKIVTYTMQNNAEDGFLDYPQFDAEQYKIFEHLIEKIVIICSNWVY